METLRMNGPQASPAQPWAWADSLASEGKSYGYSRTVPSQLGPLPGSRQFREEDACFCLFPKVRFGHGRALSCPHRSSGVNSHCHSQHPHHPLPGTEPSRPSWAESAGVYWTGISRVGRREPPRATSALPGRCHPGPRLRTPPPGSGADFWESWASSDSASRRGRSLSWSPGMRRDQVAQRRGPGLLGTSYACVIYAKQSAHRLPGQARVPG